MEIEYRKIVVEIDGIKYGLVPLGTPELKTPIESEEANLSLRSIRTLQALGVTHLEQLVLMEEAQLLSAPNFGRKSLYEIKEQLWSVCHLKIGQYRCE